MSVLIVPMRIAIVSLTQKGLSGGGRKYIQHIVPLMQEDPQVSALKLFLPRRVMETQNLGLSGLEAWPESDPLLGHRRLKAGLREFTPDVVFIPTARWLNCGNVPTVVMVRNMEALAMPFFGNPVSERIRNLVLAYLAKTACRRASRIIAVSNFVSDFLTREWSLNPGKIGIVYHGVEPPPQKDLLSIPSVIERIDGRPFIFTAGSIRPYRAYEDVIRALAILRNGAHDYCLVIAGAVHRRMSFYKGKLNELAVELNIGSRIVWAGNLSPEEMSWSFYNCATFVMTSKVEACPNIALEAMSHGCQIVSTIQPPMPEFFAHSALYYQPEDPDDLARKIIQVVNATPMQREIWRSTALSRADHFNWANTARLTIQELKMAISASNVQRLGIN